MREIKFRAWDELNRKMEYNVGIYDGKGVKYGCQWFQKENTVYNSELMQYTGLKDANNKEIYEGDLVSAYRFWDTHKQYITYFKILFKNGCFILKHCLGFEWKISEWKISESNLIEVEVIGNIYENPGLLEELKLKELNRAFK